MKILLALLLFPILIFAQDPFDKIPLKGKIASYSTSRISGDSLKPTIKVEEKVTFDKKGRLLTSYKKDNRSYSTERLELNVYEGNSIKNYRCTCKDINEFVKKFVIRDNAELKNMTGYGTGSEPSRFVKITQTDKKGNPVSVSYYSESGYKIGETKSKFDSAGNAIKIERYDIDGNLTDTELNTYNKSGKVIEKVVNRNEGTGEKIMWMYDADGKTVTESVGYSDGALMWHTVNNTKPAGDYKEFTLTNKIKNSTRVEKQVYYDRAGRETKVINLNQDGSVQAVHEYAYDAKGVLKMYSVSYKENVLSTRYDYKTDAKGNATEVTVTQLVNEYVGKEIVQKYNTTKYSRDIVYMK